MSDRRLLFFDTCGGMANQRIALVQGLMLANLTARTAVLPQMNANGVQDASRKYEENRATLVDFTEVYDFAETQRTLAPVVRVVPFSRYADRLELAKRRGKTKVHVQATHQSVEAFLHISQRSIDRAGNGTSILWFDCAFFSLAMEQDQALYDLYWSIDSALQFASSTLNAAKGVISQLKARSIVAGGQGRYNGLHLRAEQDWITHCRIWEVHDPWNTTEPGHRDNCMANTEVLANVLAIQGVSPRLPLFIAGVQLSSAWSNPVIQELNRTYDLVDKDMFLGDLKSWDEARDLLATLDFTVLGAADTFIGNSVSTFSALLLLRRKQLPEHREKLLAETPAARPTVPPFNVTLLEGVPKSDSANALRYACLLDRNPELFEQFCQQNFSRCPWEDVATHYKSLEQQPGQANATGSRNSLECNKDEKPAPAAVPGAAEDGALDSVGDFHYNGGHIPLAEVLFGIKRQDWEGWTGGHFVKAKPKPAPPKKRWKWPVGGKGGAAAPAEAPSHAAAASSSGNTLLCYVDRYPDIYSAFCGNRLDTCSWPNIEEHWEVFGVKEGRIKQCNYSQVSGEAAHRAHPLRKWVFTIASDTPQFDEMTRVAVLSAKQNTKLTPIGLVTGQYRRTGIIPWLEEQGIRLINHTPAWKDLIFNASSIAVSFGHHVNKSPQYADPQVMLASFLRLDLAILGFVDDYVLYADVDTIFTSDIENEDFGPAMPQYFTMGVEMEEPQRKRLFGSLGGDTGVMLLNVPGMRRTHGELIRWVFSEEHIANGLHFGDAFGHVQQGALEAFYGERFLLRKWPRFSWKPYWGYTPEAKIVHFQGPSPVDYLNYFSNSSQELALHALYEPLYSMCTSEAPGESNPRSEMLAGQGCTRYIELWTNWSRSASLPNDTNYVQASQIDLFAAAARSRATTLLANQSKLITSFISESIQLASQTLDPWEAMSVEWVTGLVALATSATILLRYVVRSWRQCTLPR